MDIDEEDLWLLAETNPGRSRQELGKTVRS